MVTRFFLLLGKLAVYIIPALLGSFLTYAWFSHSFLEPINPESQEKVSFEVKKGWNLKVAAQELESQGLIRNQHSVYYLGRIKSDQQDFTLMPGEYRLSESYTPAEILQAFIDKDVVYYDITLVPGMRESDLPALIAKTGLVIEEEVAAALQDKELIARIGVPSSSFEGYLWPETYRYTKPVTIGDILARMYNEGQKAKDRSLYEAADKLGFSFHQILTLASIIEKETGDPSEREMISSVFHNRLRIGMPLQSDPTVIYGIKDFNGNLTKKDLKTPSPYNTYLNTGMPPTPICMPGMASIKAALNPADSENLYFVAKGDGSHHFSATYKEHREAVQKFQKDPAARANKTVDVDFIEEIVKDAPEPQAKPKEKPEPVNDETPRQISRLDPMKPKSTVFVGKGNSIEKKESTSEFPPSIVNQNSAPAARRRRKVPMM